MWDRAVMRREAVPMAITKIEPMCRKADKPSNWPNGLHGKSVSANSGLLISGEASHVGILEEVSSRRETGTALGSPRRLSAVVARPTRSQRPPFARREIIGWAEGERPLLGRLRAGTVPSQGLGAGLRLLRRWHQGVVFAVVFRLLPRGPQAPCLEALAQRSPQVTLSQTFFEPPGPLAARHPRPILNGSLAGGRGGRKWFPDRPDRLTEANRQKGTISRQSP
mmetsp:Transcript_20413/g.44507  ORF Transcript_20413/g.44507 Transcript_20413/m.44507 type:complete len:223 (+) Transcript_20413:100-768(+)